MDTPKEIAKDLYLNGYSLENIAKILNKTLRTIQNYKSSDKDWDTLKATKYINNNQNDKQNLYQNFTDQMHQSVKEIQEAEITPLQKAEAIARLGDSYSKMSKIAGYEDPKAYSLAVIKRTIKVLIEELKSPNTINCIEKIVTLLEDKNFIEKLGNIDV